MLKAPPLISSDLHRYIGAKNKFFLRNSGILQCCTPIDGQNTQQIQVE